MLWPGRAFDPCRRRHVAAAGARRACSGPAGGPPPGVAADRGESQPLAQWTTRAAYAPGAGASSCSPNAFGRAGWRARLDGRELVPARHGGWAQARSCCQAAGKAIAVSRAPRTGAATLDLTRAISVLAVALLLALPLGTAAAVPAERLAHLPPGEPGPGSVRQRCGDEGAPGRGAALVVAAGAVAAGARFLPTARSGSAVPGRSRPRSHWNRGAAAVVCPGPVTPDPPGAESFSLEWSAGGCGALAAALDPLSPLVWRRVDTRDSGPRTAPASRRPCAVSSRPHKMGRRMGRRVGRVVPSPAAPYDRRRIGLPGGVAIADQLLRHAGATRLDALPGGGMPPRAGCRADHGAATAGDARGVWWPPVARPPP